MELDTVFGTSRLLLRPFRVEDARELHAFTGDREAMRFMNCGALSCEDTREGIKKNIETRLPEMLPLGFRAVVIKANGRVIGDCGLHRLRHVEDNPVEITYHLARAHWGKGYATEAAQCLVRHGFADLGLDEIVAAVNPANVRSIRVAEKLGLRLRTKIEWPKQGLVNLYGITREAYGDQAAECVDGCTPRA